MKSLKQRNVVDLSIRRTGDREQVLEQLFREHRAALRSFLLGRVRDTSDLDDIVQEVFMRLARNTDAVNRLLEPGANNRAYLFTAANNLIVDLERRQSVRKSYLTNHWDEAGAVVYELSPEVVVAASEELAVIKEAIKNLKPTWRKAFVLSRIKSMNYKDISEDMGVSVRQIEKYIAAAMKALRQALPSQGERNA